MAAELLLLHVGVRAESTLQTVQATQALVWSHLLAAANLASRKDFLSTSDAATGNIASSIVFRASRSAHGP